MCTSPDGRATPASTIKHTATAISNASAVQRCEGTRVYSCLVGSDFQHGAAGAVSPQAFILFSKVL